MSLRTRLVLWLGAVLAVTLGLGCVLAGWHAVASVRTEMQAALATGQQAVANGIDEIAASGAAPTAAERELRHLVATFDGNRHLRVTLTDARRTPLAASIPQSPERPVPTWFRRAIGPDLPTVVLPLPSGAITLAADPTNEAGEVWDQANDAVRTLALFFGLTVVLIYATVGRALAPLARLSTALGQIGAGDYAARLDLAGPPELANLAAGFNRMAERLGAVEAHNQLLQEQLLTLQEEERADLARDLHDEIGPFLFAAGIDAASIPNLLRTGRSSEAAEQADAIRHAVAHMQRQLRFVLGRLRPLSFGAIGLAEAIGNLVTFWRHRHPDIDFVLQIAAEDDGLTEDCRATICRVVQESLCNAIRHGAPKCVEISVTRDPDGVLVRIADDGAGPGQSGVIPGFGLVGMRERVRSQAGTLVISPRAGGRGLSVTARLPCDAST